MGHSLLPELVLKISINNQVSIGLQNVFRRPTEVFNVIGDNPDRFALARYRYATSKKEATAKDEESFDDRLDRLYPPLDITKKSQRSKKANILRRGFTKNTDNSLIGEKIPPFGAKQGQKLRECGAAVDLLQRERGGAARIVTLTLVGDTYEAFENLAANSGYIVNLLFENIRRDEEGKLNYFFVWEYQKRGALHLHICLWHENAHRAAYLGGKLVRSWYKILRDITDKTGIDMFVRRDRKTYTPQRKWQSRNEPMRKSAGGYFSKYASKASNKNERKRIVFLARKYPPSRFWGSSQSIKNIVKENTFSYSFESWKTEVSEVYYEQLVEILNEFDIAHYGSFDFKVEVPLLNGMGTEVTKRVVSEGFRQNYYYSPESFEKVKLAILKELRD